MLLGLAVALVALAVGSTESPRLASYWGNEVSLSGHVAPGVNASHALNIVLPGEQSVRGFRFQAGPAAVNFRPGGPLNGTPFRITVVGQGRAFLDVALDPANPLNAPHGPPVTYLPPGEYQLLVRSLGNATDYTVIEAVSLPFVAEQSGVFLERWLLAAPALVAAAAGLAPPWRARARDQAPPQPPAPPGSEGGAESADEIQRT